MELHERLSPGEAAVKHEVVDPFAELKDRIHLGIIEDLGRQIFNANVDPDELKAKVTAEISTRLAQEASLSRDDRTQLAADIADDILGHGPLERLLADDTVTEIMVNGPSDIWIERKGKLLQTSVRFSDESHLRRIINKMVATVGRRIDESVPMVDARLPDGSRVNAIIPPLSLTGPLVTIRKFSKKRWDLDDLIRMESLSIETADFLKRCIQAELNILVSGGTGTGKTTFLNVLSSYIGNRERIVSIEDPAELQLKQDNWVSLETRPPNVEGRGQVAQRELVRNALRMRPDRIIVGECRAGEAFDMLQAMNTGHDGSLTTVHANTPRDALSRIENMVLMANLDLPAKAIREQISSAINVVVQLSRLSDGSRRVTHLSELVGMEGDVITMHDIFTFQQYGVDSEGGIIGDIEPGGIRPLFAERLERNSYFLPAGIFQSGRTL